MWAWPAADVAAADSARLATGADLMTIASAGLAHACAEALRGRVGRVSGTRAVLLVGAGNNGGDALFAGALLRRRGVGVTALLSTDRHHGAGAAALARAGGRLVAVAPAERPGDL
ncbi:MAG TPA: NAD(P)H-hydrate epimerase, partial [Pseudonocardia sp.]|nr:NAD(P)H-hydrate epimerase [Pseudonocardia sp.]